jgi:hypothetical protein
MSENIPADFLGKERIEGAEDAHPFLEGTGLSWKVGQ